MKASLSHKSPWQQLMIVFLLAILGTIVMLILGILLLPLFFPISIDQLAKFTADTTSAESVEIFKFLQGFNTVGTFLIPGLLGAYLISSNPSSYLKLNNFPSGSVIVIILLVIVSLSGIALSDLLYRFSTAVPFPEFLAEVQEYFISGQRAMEKQIGAILEMNNFYDFVEVFVVLALLPAVCEETLFRGVIQPLFIKGFRNVHLGIIVTSIFFGVLHQQFFSFLSIAALSVVLGYLKHWSRSLWVPIIMHLINNGSLVIAVYFFNLPMEDVHNSSEILDPWQYALALFIFVSGFFALHHIFRNKRLINET